MKIYLKFDIEEFIRELSPQEKNKSRALIEKIELVCHYIAVHLNDDSHEDEIRNLLQSLVCDFSKLRTQTGKLGYVDIGVITKLPSDDFGWLGVDWENMALQ